MSFVDGKQGNTDSLIEIIKRRFEGHGCFGTNINDTIVA